MKIITQREKFLAAFQVAAGIAPTRSPKEVLNYIKIDATDGVKAVLMATDLEAGIRLAVDGIEIVKPGRALLNVQRVGNILREATDETLVFETNENSLDITGSHSEFHLPLANPDEFPSVVEFAEESYFELPARLFKELVKRTIYATDNESTRYQLGGVLFEMDGDQITTVATDGRRLACMHGQGTSIGGFKNTGMSTIVPTKTLTLMDRSVSDKDETVHIAARSNDILIRTNRCTIYSRLVEGRYPNWRQVIPNRENRTRIEGIVGPFLAAIRQASIVADPESRGIEFVFGNGSLIVAAKAQDVGTSRIEMPISYLGEEVKITMDYRFVSDFFKALDLEKPFALDVRSNSEPALFSTQDGYTYVVMPMAKQ
jgi:DNA polymerase III subunit beta